MDLREDGSQRIRETLEPAVREKLGPGRLARIVVTP